VTFHLSPFTCFLNPGLTSELNRGDIQIRVMPEEKRGPARIVLPPRVKAPEVVESVVVPEGVQVGTSERLIARMPPVRRDPWVVPLVGLVLAFSVISLIVQCLVAFS
jgi:hypothetical protein